MGLPGCFPYSGSTEIRCLIVQLGYLHIASNVLQTAGNARCYRQVCATAPEVPGEHIPRLRFAIGRSPAYQEVAVDLVPARGPLPLLRRTPGLDLLTVWTLAVYCLVRAPATFSFTPVRTTPEAGRCQVTSLTRLPADCHVVSVPSSALHCLHYAVFRVRATLQRLPWSVRCRHFGIARHSGIYAFQLALPWDSGRELCLMEPSGLAVHRPLSIRTSPGGMVSFLEHRDLPLLWAGVPSAHRLDVASASRDWPRRDRSSISNTESY